MQSLSAAPMHIDAARVTLAEILTLRDLYRREMNAQIVHDSLHERGHFDSYLLHIDGKVAGYGCVGGYKEVPRTTVKEFHVLPEHRAVSFRLFDALVQASHATRIEVQTNDRLLTLMYHDRAIGIQREKVLFHDAATTSLGVDGAIFRETTSLDRAKMFEHTMEPVGDWLLEVDGAIVATGGFMLHYNPPYADIYMEVAEGFRRRGHGSYLVQELKRACRETGRVPAARCDPSNVASRATLERAGLLPCGFILGGALEGTRST